MWDRTIIEMQLKQKRSCRSWAEHHKALRCRYPPSSTQMERRQTKLKKMCRRALIPMLALVLAFLLTLTVFAESWSNAGRFLGSDYSGYYSASVDLSGGTATISLRVSEYSGPMVLEGGVGCDITARYVDQNGNKIDIPFILTAPNSDFHTWTTSLLLVGYNLVSIDCIFSYMGSLITQVSVKAN